MTTPYPVITGPTTGGKTALAVAIAHALQDRGIPAEVVTADAFQIYRGMDIGTAKPTPEEQQGVPHHLIDLAEPTERFTVHDWLQRADPLIADLRARAVTPIVVGGTSLYVKAFLDGLFDAPPVDPIVADAVRAMSQPDRRAELERADPAAADRIHPADNRRTIRALEVFRQTGTPISTLQAQWDAARPARPDALLVGLDWPAEAINPRINARVNAMIEAGLVEEARALWAADRLGPQAREAIGYKQLIPHFEGTQSLEDAIERIKIETRRLGKNQRTWLNRFRADQARRPGLWIEAPDKTSPEIAQIIVRQMFTTPPGGC
ncbi:MAG: tRNA (adenosine(37)-N6)-dimethylallyltransferase MiaA [Phycisphaerales bacterium]|nr:tRNA (adenosine(37)-N6)-dimethylallyltransferase MiaA [Planctomycetota bacterium]MCH8509950.1 tRNA (adenosine(37)-N6)-dimethylallyltransferase MiaA [Phycisphaerales bacterium]